MARNSKIPNLLKRVRECVEAGRYRITIHADQRMSERNVTLPEVLYVLKAGWHEKRKDRYEESFESWNYAIRSQTIDDRSLRAVVAFDATEQVVLITVIDLDQDD